MTDDHVLTEKTAARIIPRSEHGISRADISDNALKVLYRLKNAGFQAYLVGGGVRDLSLGREPKDFDVATDARPEQVKALFRNCRLIGRRFRLAHVHFGPEIIEVATFRALHDPADGELEGDVALEDGRIVRDNVYGTVEEDALRRDFTMNSLYYNIHDFSVVDFANGMADLQAGLVRMIGDPEQRYREDPVRMLRAVRFAAKLGFRIEAHSAEPIPRMAGLLEHIPQARLFDEVLKLFMAGQGAETFEMLRHYRLFEYLFPDTDRLLDTDEHGTWIRFINAALRNTDQRIAEDKPVTPAFLFAALLWPVVEEEKQRLIEEEEETEPQAIQLASSLVISNQVQRVAIPKRFSLPMREIYLLQPRLLRYGMTPAKRAQRLLGHPRFRAAYDFLLLRSEVGNAPVELAQWWTDFQQGRELPKPAGGDGAGRRRRRRRPRRRPDSTGAPQ
ncbi:MAG: polynucleotide adenylyltransferase PcnB [Ectothiorhodospiraceae bacterium]|nr:polynucleotide adenylyltransferase PcnB [Ectothiorhodospiraceae bacterium]